jgi:peptide/nickel transport system permease protein
MITTLSPTTTTAPARSTGPGVRDATGRHVGRAARAIGRAVGVVVPVVLITTFITFLLGSVTGQDPAASVLGDNARPEDVVRMRGVFGLDRPFLVRYLDWLWDALHGDLGSSWFTHIPVADSVTQRLPVSLSIAAFALVIGTLVGTTLGILAALSNGGPLDRAITLLASVLSTIPGFVAAIGLVVFLSVTFPIFPSGGYVAPGDDVWLWVKCLTLPAVALSLDTAADLARQLRTGLSTALQENYVVGATMRGFSRRRIVTVHALRNGAGPAVALLGMHVPKLIGGAIIVETVFVMPGLGSLTKDAALRGDVPVVQGTLLLTVGIVVASSVLFNALLYVLRPAAKREV